MLKHGVRIEAGIVIIGN